MSKENLCTCSRREFIKFVVVGALGSFFRCSFPIVKVEGKDLENRVGSQEKIERLAKTKVVWENERRGVSRIISGHPDFSQRPLEVAILTDSFGLIPNGKGVKPGLAVNFVEGLANRLKRVTEAYSFTRPGAVLQGKITKEAINKVANSGAEVVLFCFGSNDAKYKYTAENFPDNLRGSLRTLFSNKESRTLILLIPPRGISSKIGYDPEKYDELIRNPIEEVFKEFKDQGKSIVLVEPPVCPPTYYKDYLHLTGEGIEQWTNNIFRTLSDNCLIICAYKNKTRFVFRPINLGRSMILER